jgi:hypothetical protein
MAGKRTEKDGLWEKRGDEDFHSMNSYNAETAERRITLYNPSTLSFP